MNLRRVWKRIFTRMYGLPRPAREAWVVRGREVTAGNANVQTRQVLRAEARRDAMTLVNDMAGGEPRKNRRRMALAMARKPSNWRPAAA